MIIDTTQTTIERKLMIADTQEQLRLTASDPDLVITTIHGFPFPYMDLTEEEKKWLIIHGPGEAFFARGER